MSNEIATYSMILSKLNLGKSGAECPTKTLILAISSLIIIDNASTYGANECVKIDDIRKRDSISSYGEWVITVSANPTTVPESGGTSTITATAKRTVYWTSGATTEETGNPTLTTNLGTLNGNILTLGAYTASGSRAATITATYAGKSAICRVAQNGSGTDVSYTFFVNPYTVSVGAGGGTGTVSITSYKMVGDNRYNLDYSIDTSTLPSWASFNKSTSTFTILSTSGSAGRTARVYFTLSESGKRDYAELTQTGYTPPADVYIFKWVDQDAEIIEKNFDCTGVSGSYSCELISEWNAYITDFRLSVVGGKPDWITVTHEQTGAKSKYRVNFTLTENNTNLSRNCTVKLEQNGSGKILYLNVTLAAKAADSYVFTISPNTYNATYQGSSFIPRTTSTKNGGNIGYSLTSGNTDWVVVSTTGKITVEILKNTTSNTRSTTLVFTQHESGKTQTISITQGELPSYAFTFSDNTTSKRTTVHSNGDPDGKFYIISTQGELPIGFSVSSDVSWISASISQDIVTVRAQPNYTGTRYGTVTITLNESNKTLTISVTQYLLRTVTISARTGSYINNPGQEYFGHYAAADSVVTSDVTVTYRMYLQPNAYVQSTQVIKMGKIASESDKLYTTDPTMPDCRVISVSPTLDQQSHYRFQS